MKGSLTKLTGFSLTALLLSGCAVKPTEPEVFYVEKPVVVDLASAFAGAFVTFFVFVSTFFSAIIGAIILDYC